MNRRGIQRAIALAAFGAIAACGKSGTGPDPDDLTHPARTFIVPVPFPGAAYGVAVSGSGIVLVTQISGNQIFRGGSPLAGFGDSVTVGLTPAHVAINPAGTVAFVTNQTSQTVSVVDLATDTELQAIPVGNDAFNLIVSPDGKRLYATINVGTVYAINTATMAKVDSFAAGPVANGLAFSPDGKRLFVSSRDAGRVVVYNTVTGDLVDSLVTGGMPQRMAVSADGSELYIANETLGLDIWNVGARTRIVAIPIDAYGLALSPDNMQLYVSDPQHGMVRVVDRADRAVIDSIPTGGKPRNIAFNRLGTEAIITNESGFVTIVR